MQFTFVPESESVGTVTLGGETTNDAAIPERLPRPRYPDGVWDGTLYGEFADLCARDNFIPRKFFSESLRTVTGSIVGDCLSCTLDGVNPRAYTIKIAGPGAGKGTSDDRVRQLFGGLTTAGAMLFGPKDFALAQHRDRRSDCQSRIRAGFDGSIRRSQAEEGGNAGPS